MRPGLHLCCDDAVDPRMKLFSLSAPRGSDMPSSSGWLRGFSPRGSKRYLEEGTGSFDIVASDLKGPLTCDRTVPPSLGVRDIRPLPKLGVVSRSGEILQVQTTVDASQNPWGVRDVPRSEGRDGLKVLGNASVGLGEEGLLVSRSPLVASR